MKKISILFSLLLAVNMSFGQFTPTQTLEINSKIFNGVRKVKISLPAEYQEYPNRKYKVVYLFDAQSEALYNFTKETFNYLFNNSDIYIEPVILVGIETKNRQFEFLPKNNTSQPLKDYFEQVKLGGADSLCMSLRNEVIPFIQNAYPCNGYNLAVGHSLGGSFITYSLIKFPELFKAAIAVSPNYYYDQEQLLSRFDSLTTSQKFANKFLYISYGKGDKLEERFRPSTMKMESLLKKKKLVGLRWTVKSLDNDSHGTTPMEGIFKGLLQFSRELTVDDAQAKTFAKDKKVSYPDNLKAYYKRQSELSGIQLPTIGDVNRLAYNCFYSKNYDDAIKIMKWAISLYPDDSNLYDSMGEFQINAQNHKEATVYYVEGLKIIEQQKPRLTPTIYQDKVKWFSEQIKNAERK
jgi:predicted alpha/beta superfamily hydrolase